jgi:hypothetical protein
MEEMTSKEWRTVAEAIMVWCGWGRSSWPSRKDESIVKHFGKAAAAKLLPIVQELERDFYSTDARRRASDIAEVGRIASEQFRAKHPDAPEDAVRALAWCYTYDFK